MAGVANGEKHGRDDLAGVGRREREAEVARNLLRAPVCASEFPQKQIEALHHRMINTRFSEAEITITAMDRNGVRHTWRTPQEPSR